MLIIPRVAALALTWTLKKKNPQAKLETERVQFVLVACVYLCVMSELVCVWVLGGCCPCQINKPCIPSVFWFGV